MTLFKDRLTLINVTINRGGKNLFENLNLTLEAGNSLAITGKNGAGKSSLLRSIAGFLPHSGEIEKAELLHYAGHNDPVKPQLSVEENLKFWCQLANSPHFYLKKVGLAPIKHLPASVLSAGQKRRLTLARLISIPYSLWLLDEPTASLDQSGADLLDELIKEHCQKGGIVIAATHLKMSSLSKELAL